MKQKISFIKAAIITDVVGRIDYMSNPERQKGTKEIKEKLLGFYQTPEDPNFWKELAAVNHKNNLKYNKSKIVVEAREHILQISNGIYNVAKPEDHVEIAKKLAEEFKEKYGVEVAVGIHMNDDGTDYHAHILFAERVYANEPDRGPATRNTYFDENGVRSSKAVCLDENGKLKNGCILIRKGEMFPGKKFGAKIQEFSTPQWLRKEKERQGEFMTGLCREYGVDEKWIRYDYWTNPHMKLYNLVRGEPDGLRAWKEIENEKRRTYNRVIDELLAKGEITTDMALEIKNDIYQQRKATSAKRDAMRRAYVNMKEKERREKYEDYEVNFWMRYRDDGTERNLFELLVILGMILAGVDLKEYACEGYGDFDEDEVFDDDLVVDTSFRVETSAYIQHLADELAHAAGRQSITERLAEEHVRTAASRISKETKQQNNSLDDLITVAEAKKGKQEEGITIDVFREK